MLAKPINKASLDLIREFEGCYLKAYKCPAGVWTISYGETGTFTLTGQKIQEGLTVTQEQADKSFLMTLDKKGYIDAVDRLGIKFNENQRGALVSFCYNLGTGIFTGNLLKAIKDENWVSVTSQMLLYNKCRVNGKLTVLRGLDRRRKAEVKLFLTPCKDEQEQPKRDLELENAVSKIIKQDNVQLDFSAWKRNDRIKLNINNVPTLLCKLARVKLNGKPTQEQYNYAVNTLVHNEIISSREIWDEKKYNVNNVISLLKKYASKVK